MSPVRHREHELTACTATRGFGAHPKRWPSGSRGLAMKNCLLVQLYLYFRCCRDAGCCEYKSSLKRSMKNKSSSTADLGKLRVSLNTRLCAHRFLLFGSTSWNMMFLFCRIPTPQNSPNNQKSQILLRNVCMQQKIMFFFFTWDSRLLLWGMHFKW